MTTTRAFQSTEQPTGRVHECPACLGRGFFSRPGSGDDYDCSRCHGDGTITAACAECELEGFADALIVTYDHRGRSVREVCACCAFGESEPVPSEAVRAIEEARR